MIDGMARGLDVVTGETVGEIIDAARGDVLKIVRSTYLAHQRGLTVNPRSHFLRFPDKPEARIIALPAFLGDGREVAGIKWISSFPSNVSRNLARASSVLILNDYESGYAYACLEAARISAARTAASAVLAAETLTGGRVARRVLVVGAGVLGRAVADFLIDRRWSIGCFDVFDRDSGSAGFLVAHMSRRGARAQSTADFEASLRASDVVVLVTTAATPWIEDASWLSVPRCVLNVSLRDLSVECILAAQNVLDDVDHCLSADTSPHLAEQRLGHRGFVDGTLAQVIVGDVELADDRATIFSPFGLGVLDLAVAAWVHGEAVRMSRALTIGGFFGETERWSTS